MKRIWGSPKVFISYSSEDRTTIENLYEALRVDGYHPWLDKEGILPGEDWDSVIRKAVGESDIVIICLSASSVVKKGYFQKEIKLILELASEKPDGQIFIIPARQQLHGARSA